MHEAELTFNCDTKLLLLQSFVDHHAHLPLAVVLTSCLKKLRKPPLLVYRSIRGRDSRSRRLRHFVTSCGRNYWSDLHDRGKHQRWSVMQTFVQEGDGCFACLIFMDIVCQAAVEIIDLTSLEEANTKDGQQYRNMYRRGISAFRIFM